MTDFTLGQAAWCSAGRQTTPLDITRVTMTAVKVVFMVGTGKIVPHSVFLVTTTLEVTTTVLLREKRCVERTGLGCHYVKRIVKKTTIILMVITHVMKRMAGSNACRDGLVIIAQHIACQVTIKKDITNARKMVAKYVFQHGSVSIALNIAYLTTVIQKVCGEKKQIFEITQRSVVSK